MIRNVVVTYQVKPEAVAEHVRLIEGIFAHLQAERPEDLEYKVLVLDDGVSFVHVSTSDTPDGSNPLPAMAAFQAFGRDIGDRVATSPAPTAAQIVGSYLPGVPISTAGEPGARPAEPE